MKKLLIVITFLIGSLMIQAQPGNGGGPPPPPPNNGNEHPGWEIGHGNPHGAPVGGGTYILLALAGGYVIYKRRKLMLLEE